MTKETYLAIIDMIYSLLGALLDFLEILPCLRDEAVVVFHDILYHLLKYRCLTALAAGFTFIDVAADDFIMRLLCQRSGFSYSRGRKRALGKQR